MFLMLPLQFYRIPLSGGIAETISGRHEECRLVLVYQLSSLGRGGGVFFMILYEV